MRTLSKSKLLSFRQCPKRMWLEIHRKELCQDSSETQTSFNVGNQVGEIARRVYDPEGTGTFIDIERDGFNAAFAASRELLKTSKHPVFEAGFNAAGGLAFADVMLPVPGEDMPRWRMIEIKSSTSLKDYYRDDIAVQTYLARAAGISLDSVSLAHIDNTWVYPGGGDYRGLFRENDLTDEALARGEEVRGWMADAQRIAAGAHEPDIEPGEQCSRPYECGFHIHCTRYAVQAEYPVTWFPRPGKKLKEAIEGKNITDMREVDDALLNPIQLRVKQCTVNKEVYFDVAATSSALAKQPMPAYFLDFETINLAVPIWAGTRPYQMVPFQFSLHIVDETDTTTHHEFLDLSGDDPSRAFAECLVASCGRSGAIYVYNAGFESSRIKELASRFPDLETGLMSINTRIVDLLPLAREHYYHPSQQGSWSIKQVLPALAPELSYEKLDGVQNGGMAMEAFAEAMNIETSADRKEEIHRQLLEYCKLDTLAMVRVWEKFLGRVFVRGK